MEHVEVLRDLSEVCRAAIKAGDWKVDGACDPDSLLRHADAAIASLSAQPPAEAQPVAKLVNRKDADGGKTTTFIRPTSLGMDLPLGEYPLHLHPSAPVGVNKSDLMDLLEIFQSHQGPCRPESDEDDIILWDRTEAAIEALAQQPAAVDGAMVTDEMMERAESAWDVTTNGYGRFITGNNWRECLRAALTAALAAQPGGSDNDR